MNKVTVSAILPLFNGRRFVKRAVASMLEQTRPPDEIWIIDDGSTDKGTDLIPVHPAIRIIRQSNSGVAAARNRAISESSGDLIAFLDQDDCWTPDKLERQITVMLREPHLGYVLAHQLIRLAPGIRRPRWLKPEQVDNPCVGYLPGTLVVRRTIFEQVGPFNTEYRSGSDSEWFFRARNRDVPMKILDDVLLHREIHRHNQSHDTATANRELLRLVRASLKDRRSGR